MESDYPRDGENILTTGTDWGDPKSPRHSASNDTVSDTAGSDQDGAGIGGITLVQCATGAAGHDTASMSTGSASGAG